MKIPCRQISPYAKGCLQKLERFQMLSKFESVLNLWDGKNVLSLQTDQTALTPLSLVLRREDFRAVSAALERDLSCSAGGGVLRGENWTIDAKEAKLVICRFPKREERCPKESLHCLARAAQMLAKPDSLCQLVIPPQEQNFDAVQRSALELLERGKPEELMGLGGGLTPAGDDFLVGCLAFLYRYGTQRALDGLRDALYETGQRTTALSQAFLERAMEGEFSTPVLALFAALERGGQEKILTCTARLCAIGHTSGSDLLGGILYAARQFEEETEENII